MRQFRSNLKMFDICAMFFTIYTQFVIAFTHAAAIHSRFFPRFCNYLQLTINIDIPSVHVTSPSLYALKMPKSDCRLKREFELVQIDNYCSAIDVFMVNLYVIARIRNLVTAQLWPSSI